MRTLSAASAVLLCGCFSCEAASAVRALIFSFDDGTCSRNAMRTVLR